MKSIILDVRLGIILLGIAGLVGVHAQDTLPLPTTNQSVPKFSFGSIGIRKETNKEVTVSWSLEEPPHPDKMSLLEYSEFAFAKRTDQQSMRKFEIPTHLAWALRLEHNTPEQITSIGRRSILRMFSSTIRDTITERYRDYWESEWNDSGLKIFLLDLFLDSVNVSEKDERPLVSSQPTTETLELLNNQNREDDQTGATNSPLSVIETNKPIIRLSNHEFIKRLRIWNSYAGVKSTGLIFGRSIINEFRVQFSADPFDFGDVDIADEVVHPTSKTSHLVFGAEYTIGLLDRKIAGPKISVRWEKKLPGTRFFMIEKTFFSVGGIWNMKNQPFFSIQLYNSLWKK